MRYYETLYLINPNLSDDDYSNVVTKFSDFVEKNKGVIVKVDEWGKKTLAYEVKKFDKGYYVVLSYCGEPDLIALLKREFKLDERIIKYQTVKLSDNEDPETLKQQLAPPEKVGEAPPAKVGEEAPEKAGEAPPAKVGEAPPEKAGEAPPEKAGEVAPEKAGEVAPEKAGEVAPAKVGEEAPEKAGEVAPVKDGEEPETSSEAISEKEGENGV